MGFSQFLNRLKKEEKIGITSICSANKFVIEAAMIHAKKYNYELLIESTSNQVDQFGGYTGMTPNKFVDYVKSIADKISFPIDNLTFGGDHLGPNVWKNLDSNIAMKNAEDQIKAYVSSGYSKIHLDTSFILSDDKSYNGKLPPEVITKRAAQLCKVAEGTNSSRMKDEHKLYYIIGTDVPIPGGAIENEEELEITSADDLEATIELTKKEFYKNGLEDAWERVIGVVVQPGVEFSDSKILDYSRERNSELLKKINDYQGLYFEAHSTDYQKLENLKMMVEDKFAILKVGPWLTFALREALFALAYIENELSKSNKTISVSNFFNIIETAMTQNSQYWIKHYQGNAEQTYLARNFSYSDRVRYYWSNSIVDKTVSTLLNNLSNTEIPDYLLSQFMPNQYKEIRYGKISKKAEELIFSKISEVLSIYYTATGGNIEN